jgi:glucose/mannose-6-phosphate isomerase
MGGSALPAEILRAARPELDLWSSRDYDLPPLADLSERLIVISSHSGTTVEALSSFDAAIARGLTPAVITTGGALLERAREHKVPYVLVPALGIEPRQALGFMVRALMAVIQDAEGLAVTRRLSSSLDAALEEEAGVELAKKLKGTIPIIYSSAANGALARIWKVKLNEGAKIPAFWNVLPEANHNEIAGFDLSQTTKGLSGKFHFIFLSDPADDSRIAKRFSVLEEMYHTERGLAVEIVQLEKKERYETMFSNLLLADWVAYHLARMYGMEPEKTPMVEEFKDRIQS